MNGIPPVVRRSYLRMIVFAVCLTACTGMAALWVRSYFVCDRIISWTNDRDFFASSLSGRLALNINTSGARPREGWKRRLYYDSTPVAQLQKRRLITGRTAQAKLGFAFELTPSGSRLAAAPHWFFVLVSGVLAMTLKPKPRWQFSLAELLIVLSVASVAIACVASASYLANMGSPSRGLPGGLVPPARELVPGLPENLV